MPLPFPAKRKNRCPVKIQTFMSGIKSRRPMAVHTSPSLEDGEIFQSLQLSSGLGVDVRSSSPSHWISTYFQTSSRQEWQESTQTTSHMFHQQYRGTWRISQSVAAKKHKGKVRCIGDGATMFRRSHLRQKGHWSRTSNSNGHAQTHPEFSSTKWSVKD